MKLSRRAFIAGTSSAVAVAALAKVMDNLQPLSAAELEVLTSGRNSNQRKWVFVIDLDKCDGCKQCTKACIAGMYVPPAWGEPNYEGKQQWIQVFEIDGDAFMPVPCQNCQNAPCVKVCPVGATHYTEDGIVLIDQDRCIGCRICMAACPYQRRFFNWFDPPVSEAEKAIKYSPDRGFPHRRGVTDKCNWCADRVRERRLPHCIETCTKAGMRALWFGDAGEDVVTNGEETERLSAMLKRRGAFRLKEELGTQPSVIYLPLRGGNL